jgi:hypothetical protein
MKILRAGIFFAAFATVSSVISLSAAPMSFPEVKDLPVQTNLPDVMTMADGTKVTRPRSGSNGATR